MIKNISILITISFAFLYANLNAQDVHTYVGVKSCSPCHKTEKQGKQLEIWQNSKHSKAIQTLQTDESNAIAKELGHTTPAVETEACLKCHATGYNLDASMLGAKFEMSDGVQCETCHGPGSDYKSSKIMKDREASIKNGMVVHENLEDFCTPCHNEESPTFKGFVFNEWWDKIKHPVPGN